MLLYKLGRVKAAENKTLNLQCNELQRRCSDLQDKLEIERIRQNELTRHYESVKQHLGQQNQMRRAMMNILNDAELARHDAETLSTVKGQFLANMSHEIRTPLNGIIGMNQLLQFTELSEEQKDFVETSLSAADSLLKVVNDVLDFSQLEEGVISIEYHDFDLSKLVDNILETVSGTAAEKGIDLVLEIQANVPTLLIGDSFRIKQIMLNLTNNAVRFTEKGEIGIRIELLSQERDDVVIQCSVVDTGIGIPIEKQDSLFKPFSQVDGSTTRKYGGNGLGLVISKNLVEAMSGEIHFRSTPEGGSEFWFTLPLTKQAKESKATVSLPKELLNKRFLIVEDRIKRKATIASHLNEWGCEKIDCLSRSEILPSLKYNADVLHRCDIVVIDGELMDEKDNTLLATQLKSISPKWKPVVLVISKLEALAEWQKEIGQTIDEVLTVPIRQQTLAEGLTKVCKEEIDSLREKRDQLGDDLSVENLHILVVEDNKVNQKVVERLLYKMGCKTTCVENGLQALHAVTENTYDLILMDYQMPVMNGCVATEEIRKLDSPVSRIPIIGLTANAIQCNRETAISSGMNDYLSKPVLFDALKKALIGQL
jgi:signal transduction histidine kinase/CheY-like chemotaxis protein